MSCEGRCKSLAETPRGQSEEGWTGPHVSAADVHQTLKKRPPSAVDLRSQSDSSIVAVGRRLLFVLLSHFPPSHLSSTMPSSMEDSPPPTPSPPSPPSGSDSEGADNSDMVGTGRRKRPLRTGIGSVPAATDFTIFVRDVVGITRDVVMVTPMPSVMHKREGWQLAPAFEAQSDTRSPLWGLLDVYERLTDAAAAGDVLARCRVCALTGADTFLFLKAGAPSNGTKHMEGTAKGKASPCRRADHLQAALYLAKNAQGGNRTRVVAANGTIRRFMQPMARREHHLRFVQMQVMTRSPHAFGQNTYVRVFLDGLKSQYSPPALDAVAHLLTELASFVSDGLRALISAAKEAYAGAPFCHVVTDLWTEEHSHRSYGSLVVRLTDLETGTVREFFLGVLRCSGRHNYNNIRSWVVKRLSIFGVELQEVSSATTDSGSNVRKAMIGFSGAWVPCAAHAIHNAVRHAVGGSGETAAQRASRIVLLGGRAGRARKSCRNTAAREFLGCARSTIRFF